MLIYNPKIKPLVFLHTLFSVAQGFVLHIFNSFCALGFSVIAVAVVEMPFF